MNKKTTRTYYLFRYLLTAVIITSLITGCKKDAVKTVSKSATDSAKTITDANPPLKNMFGVNTYPWDFLQNPANPSDVSAIYQPKMNFIESFSEVRHYLDWNLLEDAEGSYTYNPCNSGSWNLDAIYAACQANDITSLVDIKSCPTWFLNAYYPAAKQNAEDVPAPYGADLSQPGSYIDQAKVAFQFAARYGSNKNVNTDMLSVNSTPRWTNDPINVIKVGQGTVKYVECDNERDMWWGGPATVQTAAQYAANMSAFYDGDQGRLGKNVGVKNADPNMIVVMGGLAKGDTQWLNDMITWCIQHRGYKSDGSVNLCFDVINYHYYNSNLAGTEGAAPELCGADTTANAMVAVARSIKDKPEVWITESGYDVNSGSSQRAPAIGTKSALLVQGDWILRTSFMYIKHGIKRLFFYQLFDDTPGSGGTFATSGLCDSAKRRPAANYILQTRTLMGNYTYEKTISSRPMVDVYVDGAKTMYVLFMPTASGATSTYTLKLGTSSATLYTLNPDSWKISSAKKATVDGSIKIAVSETPVFVSN